MTVQDQAGTEYQDLVLDVAGTRIPFRALVAQTSGNVYFAVAKVNKSGVRKPSPYGIRIAPLADTLPDKVTIFGLGDQGEGTVVHLEKGVTDDNRANATGGGKVALPNGLERTARVSISRTKDGNWNLKAAATGSGGGSAQEPVSIDLL